MGVFVVRWSVLSGSGSMIVVIALTFLVASWVLAIVRRTVSPDVLALWAIASYMILPRVVDVMGR